MSPSESFNQSFHLWDGILTAILLIVSLLLDPADFPKLCRGALCQLYDPEEEKQPGHEQIGIGIEVSLYNIPVKDVVS